MVKQTTNGFVHPTKASHCKRLQGSAKQVAVPTVFRPQPTTGEAWKGFTTRLEMVLADLEEDDFLILSSKRANSYIQFAAQGAYGMRVEATSNAFLDEEHQLSSSDQERLFTFGWQAPTYLKAKGTKEPADGAPNYFIDIAAPLPHHAIAVIAADTLRQVYNVQHPGELEYRSFNMDKTKIRHPTLGLKRAAS